MITRAGFIKIMVFIAILVVAIWVAYTLNVEAINQPKSLKIYAAGDVNKVLVDSSLHNNFKDHYVLDFKLVNQDGDTITQLDFKDKIYVTDFFFTTCGSICPKMTSQLQRINERFAKNEEVMILSHTVWPEVDSIPVLKSYADNYEAETKKWMFVTGDKKHLYELARKSYFVAPDLNNPDFEQGGEGDFIHTENLVLIDKKKQIRGYYDGTSETEVNQLMSDIKKLIKE
jgi:protein SCO1/2